MVVEFFRQVAWYACRYDYGSGVLQAGGLVHTCHTCRYDYGSGVLQAGGLVHSVTHAGIIMVVEFCRQVAWEGRLLV